MSPKYVIITPFFPSASNWRGPYVYDQAMAIARSGRYEVVVMRPMAWPHRVEDYEVGGIRVYGFRTFEMPSYLFDGLTDGINAKSFLHRVKELGIDLQTVAVIHGHTVNAAAYGLAARKLNPNIRVAVQHHCLDPYTVLNGRCAGWRLNARYRARHALGVFNDVDLHLSISKAVQDSLLAFPKARPEETYRPYLERMRQMEGLPSVRPKHLHVLYNGVDTELFHRSGKRGREEKVFRIGCIANFQMLKDHKTLLRAMERLKQVGHEDFRLSLIGSGEKKTECQAYISASGLTDCIEWHDEVPHAALPEYYRSLDLYVMPSMFEGFGCVYTEAYACGVPFIACRNQGAAELIVEEEQNVWTINPGDDEQLASLIADYAQTRYEQHLKQEIGLEPLIRDYLDFLETLRG